MTFTPTPFNDNNQQSPKDWTNIILFIALTLMMGYIFDVYVMKPREQAMLAAAQAEKTAAEAGLDPKTMEPAPRPRDVVIAGDTRAELQNAEVDATISTHRPRLDDLMLKNHFMAIDKKQRVALLSPAGTEHPVLAETGWMADDKTLVFPGPDTVWHEMPGRTPNSVTFEWSNGSGLNFTRTIGVDDKFLFTITDTVKNDTGKPVTLWPYGMLSQHGIPKDMQSGIVHEGSIGYIGEQYVEQKYSKWAKLKDGKFVTQAKNGWIGITSRYFFVGLIPDQTDDTVFRTAYKPVENKADKNAKERYQVDVQGSDRTVAAGATSTYTLHVFAGAKQLRTLEAYGKQLGLVHFDLAMDFGWFYFLTKPFYYGLAYINDYVGNFGVAIILLTCLIRLAVYPLASTSFRSFAKMKKVQPKIQELQKLHAGDKAALQQELVKLYQTEKVNPLSGCLPVLFQIPIFFAIYKVINVSIEMRHAPFFGWIKDLSAPDPTSLFNLYGALPYDVPPILHFGIWPTILFVLIMIQVRLSPPQPDKMMMIFFNYYYPVMVCFMMSKFAAGLVIYWCCSSFLSLAQQMFIMHTNDTPIHLFEQFKKKQPPVDEVLEQTAVVVDDNNEPPPAPNLPDHVRPKKKNK